MNHARNAILRNPNRGASRATWPASIFVLAASMACVAAACSDAQAPGSASPGASASKPALGASAPLLDPSAIDEGKLLTLTGNTHPKATPSNSVGRMPEGEVIEGMQLVLTRSPEREAALEATIDALHDPTSPLYQHWLTASEFGDQYGVAEADIEVITRWLTSHGLRVDGVPTSRMFIEFSGTAEQVSRTFHTEMHNLSVKGVHHIGNMSDPQIPAELAKVVVGVHSLHNFMPHPMRKDRGAVKRDHTTGSWSVVTPSPNFTGTPYGGCTSAYASQQCLSGTCNTTTGNCTCATDADCVATPTGGAATCNTKTKTCVECKTNADCGGPATCNTATNACTETVFALAPADFATVYNVNPLLEEGITGAGQTVVVIEDTTIQNASDVTTFRTAFGLVTNPFTKTPYGGTFTQGSPTGNTKCRAPGVNEAEGEAALDAEWAASAAPGAAIQLAACADTATFGGLIALENLINGANPPPIVSISYGECESANGNAANKNFVNAYQQAVAVGTSVFVSSGDEGAASCDANEQVATNGIAVSGWASTPYNVAVGGTDFMDYVNSVNGGPPQSTYWNTANTSSFGSALSYIPEIPWNDSCASKLIYSTPSIALGTYTEPYGATGFCNSTYGANFQTTGAGSGGPSNYSAQPTWQTGVVGLPAKSGGKRGLPDVSLFAANGVMGHFLVFCLTDTAQGGGPCDYTSSNDTYALAAGGTSFASPAMAGIQALVNQRMTITQGSTYTAGNPNYTYYKLAAAEQGPRGSARCNASSTVLPAEGCIFNDVTAGDIDVNCTGTDCYNPGGTAANGDNGALSTSTTSLKPAYAAGVGWDYATGLGTVNAYNLVNAWSK